MWEGKELNDLERIVLDSWNRYSEDTDNALSAADVAISTAILALEDSLAKAIDARKNIRMLVGFKNELDKYEAMMKRVIDSRKNSA